MVHFNILKQFNEVPEQMIKDAANAIPGDNNFKQLLIYAEVFRMAECTPMFLTNNEQTLMYTTCRETFGRKLH